MMAELGAEIIKIEQPPYGDPMRGQAPRRNRRSGSYVQQNRGKLGVCLDLKRPENEWPLSRTALRKTRDSGLALLATDARRDPDFEGSGSVHKLNIRSVLSVPLGRDPVCAHRDVGRRGSGSNGFHFGRGCLD